MVDLGKEFKEEEEKIKEEFEKKKRRQENIIWGIVFLILMCLIVFRL